MTRPATLGLHSSATGNEVKVLGNDQGRYSAEMTAHEVFVCRAALREVLYGFSFPDFKARMGCTREEAAAVLHSLPNPSNEDIDRTATAEQGNEP